MFKTKFEQCPMYSNATERALTLDNIVKSISNLEVKQQDIEDCVKKHREDERVHHTSINSSITTFSKAIDSLLEDQKNHRADRDKRERIKEKVLGSIITAFSLSASYWLYDILVNLDKVNHAITGG